MAERRGRGKARNMNRGLMGMDSGGESGGGAGERIGEKGRTTVSVQQ